MAVLPTPGPDLVGSVVLQGPNRPRCADAVDHYRENHRYAVTIVDGTGSSEDVVRFANNAAYFAARVAVRCNPLQAVLGAAVVAGRGGPDGAMVTAVAERGQPWHVAWVGDCQAWAWDGITATRITAPHTLGEKLRRADMAENLARKNDNKIFHGIGRATPWSVPVAATPARVIVLASDGMKLNATQIGPVLMRIERTGASWQEGAESLAGMARANGSGDDIAVVLATHPFMPPADTADHIDGVATA